jgi:hypothetical protein
MYIQNPLVTVPETANTMAKRRLTAPLWELSQKRWQPSGTVDRPFAALALLLSARGYQTPSGAVAKEKGFAKHMQKRQLFTVASEETLLLEADDDFKLPFYD